MGRIKILTVGRIVRLHGVKGQVEIAPATDTPDRFRKGAQFHVNPPGDHLQTITITDNFWKKGRIVVGVAGFETREDAQALIGRELSIPESEGEKPPGAFWHHEIIGCTVATIAGETLGQVVEIIRTGGNDVYVVKGAREYLIPATGEVVQNVDVDSREIMIKPLPGLLD